ncbi:hypothetical protein [uncultured Methanolobus sp.]|uniref:hypothetical protein n=1 Tax=uncultured Methanolobus sp. TaxID=218300 RepID=UPI002AAAB9CB|nr:hypothetical protein [uncultured Methanolobus sp.]
MRNKLVMLCCLTIFLSSLMPAVATTKTITAENTDEKNGLLKWVEVEYGEETMQEIEKYIELSKTSSDFTKSTNNLEKAEDEIPIIKKLEAEIGEEKIKEINAEIEFQKTLPDVVKAMPYKALAAASPEAQKAHLGYIDNFSISEKEKEQFKKELIDLWDRYPYEITEDDYTITSKIGPMIEDYIYNTYWKGTDYDYKMVGTRWYSDEHEDFIGEACDAYPIYASEARSSASEPDNGVIDPLPFYRYYNHYEDGYWHIGGAPGRCDLFTTQAIDNRDDGDLRRCILLHRSCKSLSIRCRMPFSYR